MSIKHRRKARLGESRIWQAIGVQNVNVLVEGKAKMVTLVVAHSEGETGHKARGIFRLDEWRKLKAVTS